MRSLARAAIRVLPIAIACLVVLPSVAHAQEEEFKKGMVAFDAKSPDWADVAAQMRAAIMRDSTENAKTIRYKTGLFIVGAASAPYLPHYFLGEALYHLGDCATAVGEWSTSEQQGVIKSRPEFAQYARSMDDGIKQCAAKGVLPPIEFGAQVANTRTAITDVSTRLVRVQSLRDAHQDVWRPDLNDQLASAQADTRNAQTRLNAALRSRSARDFQDARSAAEHAAVTLYGLESLVNSAVATQNVLSAQSRDIDQAVGAADAADKAIDATKFSLPTALATQRQAGRDLIARARERARDAQATRSLTAANEALRSAQDAKTSLEAVLDQVKKAMRDALTRDLASASDAATESLSFIDASYANLTKLAGQQPGGVTADMTAHLESLQKRLTAMKRTFDSARKAQDLAAVRDVNRLASEARVEIDGLMTSFGPVTLATRGVRPALEDGARQFFAGEYDKVVRTLDPGNGLADAPMQLHIHLFRAAALYALYVRSGDQDQSLRTKALAEVQACQQLEPAFRPDPRAFAPRFISFYQNGGAPVSRRAAATAP